MPAVNLLQNGYENGPFIPALPANGTLQVSVITEGG